MKKQIPKNKYQINSNRQIIKLPNSLEFEIGDLFDFLEFVFWYLK